MMPGKEETFETYVGQGLTLTFSICALLVVTDIIACCQYVYVQD